MKRLFFIVSLWLGSEALAINSNCGERIIDALYEASELSQFATLAEFLHWRDQLPKGLGLNAALIESQESRLSPELLSLMRGKEVPSGKLLRTSKVSGGWGQDYLWAPLIPHWNRVQGNFGPLVERMGTRLHLSPILRRQLFRSDVTTLPDSGWVLAESSVGQEPTTASVKITFFDREMSPDSVWPRYSLESPIESASYTLYRRAQARAWPYSEMLQSGHFTLKSSLDHWGLLPLEEHTGFRVDEHRPENYEAKYSQLFSDAFLLAHRDLMEYVLAGYSQPDIAERLALLMDFRKHMLPPAALEVAELGRFNIPPGSAPSSRVQLFYGVTVMLQQRPAKTLYLLAPRPHDPHRPANTFPQTEIMFVQPGYEWLREAVERVIAEENAGLAEYKEPEHDPLRGMYEALGFEVVKTYAHCFGTPNGCHVMRVSREKFLGALVKYQLENRQYLTKQQLQLLQIIAK